MAISIYVIKYILFATSFLILVCGIALIAVGVIRLSSGDKKPENILYFKQIEVYAIAVGILFLIISILGFYGGYKEHNGLLIIYASSLTVLAIINIVLSALTFTTILNKKKLERNIFEELNRCFDKYFCVQDCKNLVDDLQKMLTCCGVTSSTYWNGSLPLSCCNFNNISNNTCSISNAYKKGCGKALTTFVTEEFTLIGGVAIGLAINQLLGAIMAYLLITRVELVSAEED